MILTARELAHLLNNELAPAVGILELLQYRADLPADLYEMSQVAARQLDKAVVQLVCNLTADQAAVV